MMLRTIPPLHIEDTSLPDIVALEAEGVRILSLQELAVLGKPPEVNVLECDGLPDLKALKKAGKFKPLTRKEFNETRETEPEEPEAKEPLRLIDSISRKIAVALGVLKEFLPPGSSGSEGSLSREEFLEQHSVLFSAGYRIRESGNPAVISLEARASWHRGVDAKVLTLISGTQILYTR